MAELVAEEQPQIDAEDDNDSTLGDEDPLGSTKSLDSAYEWHVWEGGRRYHGFRKGQYAFPNDESENNREDIKHHATRLLLNDRLQSTIFDRPPIKVLDIGTGTGIWAIDFADEHESSGCHVIGIDLSPIQPNVIPPNLEFQIYDIEEERDDDDIDDGGSFEPSTFDFIHVRYMATAIKNWPRLIKRVRKMLKPGGKIELTEMYLHYRSDDGTVTEDNKLLGFLNTLLAAGPKLGIDLDAGNSYETWLKQESFVNVKSDYYKLPMGPWPKDKRLKAAGYFHREQFLQGIGGIAMGLYGRGMGWSPAEIEVELVGVRQDINNRRIHGYWMVQSTTAELPAAN